MAPTGSAVSLSGSGQHLHVDPAALCGIVAAQRARVTVRQARSQLHAVAVWNRDGPILLDDAPTAALHFIDAGSLGDGRARAAGFPAIAATTLAAHFFEATAAAVRHP